MPRLRRFGVRGRVQAAFALLGLLVSVFLAAVSFNLTSTYLYTQREIATTRSALVSVDLLSRALDGPGAAEEAVRQSAGLGNDAVYLPRATGRAVSATGGVTAPDLPPRLVELAFAGTAAQQRVVLDGRPFLAIALPVAATGGVYVELFPLAVLDATLRGLSLILTATAVLGTLLSAALGRWATHRTLRPLQQFVAASGEAAHGALDTRLDAAGDPDLEPLAHAFNTTIAALERRVARDARFAGDVSHELRSPVTTMINAAELLRNRRSELSPASREGFDLLDEEVQRFRVLVEDLLEVSRDDQLSAGEDELVVVPVARFVRRVADGRAGRPVTRLAGGAEDLVVHADPRRLERVIINLVDNACLHGRGVRDVVVAPTEGAVRVTVRDDGQGVPTEERTRIFERFYRGSASRGRLPGSGLGLALVEQHVARHGGRVWVEDAQPRGAAFVVELPVSGDRP